MVPTIDSRRAESGSVAVTVALLIPALVAVAALAVDLAYFLDRASQLQTAADAAALGGVVEHARGHDPSTEIEATIRANGLDPTNLDVITTLGDGTVTVEITEPGVNLFFSSLLVENVEIGRVASAELQTCGKSCERSEIFPDPFQTVQTFGTGDGYIPTLVGNRIYALNHHMSPGRRLQCVDRATNSACPNFPRAISSTANTAGFNDSDGDFYTGVTSELIAVGSRLYFVGQKRFEVGVGCWDTTTDLSCGYLKLAAMPVLPPSGASVNTFFWARMHGPDFVDGKLYFMASDQRVYCAVPDVVLTVCPGSWPVNSGLIAGGAPTYDAFSPGTSQFQTPLLDSEVIDRRIYAIFNYGWGSNPSAGAYIHCFDTVVGAPCANWANGGATKVKSGTHAFPSDPASRIFVRYDTSDQPEGVCYREFKSSAHYCVNLNGVPVQPIPNFSGYSSGRRSFAELHLDGRTYFPQGYELSATECWDWTTQSSCGRVDWHSIVGGTRDYGYAAEGNCLFGLGDSSIFWTFDRDMNSPCTSSSTTLELFPCTCQDGSASWGEITIENLDLTRVSSFVLTLTAPDGSLLDTIDALTTTGSIDISHIPTTHASILLSASIEPMAGYNPWAAAVGPTITARIDGKDIPKLVG